ncbi:MAG: SRPBCC family protein [Flavisolibacter sp.]
MKTLLRILASLLVVIIAILAVFYLMSDGPSTIVSHVRINKPPQVVFNYISDMRNELKWNPDVLYMQKTTDGPVGVGTHFKAKWHMSDTLDEEITRFDPPNNLTFENGGALAVSLQVHLSGVDSATEMEARFIATPHGFLRAIFPIMRSKLKEQEAENMVNLKRALEKNQN